MGYWNMIYLSNIFATILEIDFNGRCKAVYILISYTSMVNQNDRIIYHCVTLLVYCNLWSVSLKHKFLIQIRTVSQEKFSFHQLFFYSNTLKQKGHQGDCPFGYWRWGMKASMSPVTTRVVILMTFPFQCMYFCLGYYFVVIHHVVFAEILMSRECHLAFIHISMSWYLHEIFSFSDFLTKSISSNLSTSDVL